MNASHQTALTTAPGAGADDASQYLIFTLNGESFALDILQIREIIEFGQHTAVPMMPATVRGVINLRGAVVPVIDLSARFGRGQTPISPRTCIVILEIEGGDGLQVVGVIVDSVTEVLEIRDEAMEPAPTFGARIRSDFMHGMGRMGERFVIVLDAQKVLSLEDMTVLVDPIGTEAEALLQ